MKKILIVSTLEAVPWGGSEELWYFVAKKSLDEGITVGISRLEWDPIPNKLQELLEKEAKIFYRPNVHVSRPKTDIAFRIKNQIHKLTYLKDLQQFHPDSIFINQGGNFDNYLEKLGPYLLQTKVPYYIICHHAFEHGYLEDNRRFIFRKIFSKAAKVIFVSERNKEVTERELAFSIPSAQVIYHPPITIYKNDNLLYPKLDTIKLACVARLDVPYKGQDILLQTLSSGKWRGRNWQLNFYGKGPHQKFLEELVDLYNLPDKVNFKGHVADITTIWAENHLLVLPSISEGTPLSLIEACYYSRAAVATDVGGSKEIIIDNETGFIAAAANIYALDKCLEKAWQKRHEWEEMGKRAKNRIEEVLKGQDFDAIFKAIIQ